METDQIVEAVSDSLKQLGEIEKHIPLYIVNKPVLLSLRVNLEQALGEQMIMKSPSWPPEQFPEKAKEA